MKTKQLYVSNDIDTDKLSEAVQEALDNPNFAEEASLWLKAKEYIAKRNAEAKSHFDKVTTELQQVTCLTCDTIIKKNEEFPEHPIHQSMIDGGNVNTFSCGFGSRFDMDTYVIGICDDCLEKLISQQKALKI